MYKTILKNDQETAVKSRVMKNVDQYTYISILHKMNDIKEFNVLLNTYFDKFIKEYNVYAKEVVSYTTREKREGEIDGREHYFITKERAKEILESSDILAYTKIGEYEYFTTKQQLKDSNIYIIDPKGIEYLKESNPDLNIKVIYISIPDNIREERCKNRSDYDTAYKKRYESENEQFTKFEESKSWDINIINTDIITSLSQFIEYIIYEMNSRVQPLFLIVARTGSGKDTLLNEAKRLINGEGI